MSLCLPCAKELQAAQNGLHVRISNVGVARWHASVGGREAILQGLGGSASL